MSSDKINPVDCDPSQLYSRAHLTQCDSGQSKYKDREQKHPLCDIVEMQPHVQFCTRQMSFGKDNFTTPPSPKWELWEMTFPSRRRQVAKGRLGSGKEVPLNFMERLQEAAPRGRALKRQRRGREREKQFTRSLQMIFIRLHGNSFMLACLTGGKKKGTASHVQKQRLFCKTEFQFMTFQSSSSRAQLGALNKHDMHFNVLKKNTSNC